MRLKKITAKDLPIVLAMMREYYAYDGLDFDVRRARRRLGELARKAALGAAWVLLEAGEPAGYLFVIRGFGVEHGRNVLIDELYLRKPYRRRGWGRGIVRHVQAYARRVRAESVHAQVERHNRPACRFWSAMGFRRFDRYAMVQLLH